MAFLLVNLFRGIFEDIYTNSQDSFDVHVMDEDDRHDSDYSSYYAAYDYLIRYGSLQKMQAGGNPGTDPTDRSCIFQKPLARRPEAMELIDKYHQADGDAALQQLDAAFAAGYLECISEISQSLNLRQETHEDVSAAKKFLIPITTAQYERFVNFVESLNDVVDSAALSCGEESVE